MKNQFKDIVINHYNNYEEDKRFDEKCKNVEFLTTMRYIQKFAKKGCKILEVGAGTGKYSIALAKLGYDVTAVDLTPHNIEILKKNSKNIKNLQIFVGDALNLPFDDNQFDIVLNLGPMYHLYTNDNKSQAINETIRVCKNDGFCMFAYLTHASIVWGYGVRKNKFSHLKYALNENGSIQNIPEEIFTSYYIEDFNNQFENTPTSFITNVATDGLFPTMRDYIGQMNDEDFENLLNWHYTTCEREDQQGYSSHMLYICKKNILTKNSID